MIFDKNVDKGKDWNVMETWAAPNQIFPSQERLPYKLRT